MATIFLTRADVTDLLTALDVHAEKCDVSTARSRTSMLRGYWSARAERARTLYERIISADGVMLVENDRSK